MPASARKRATLHQLPIPVSVGVVRGALSLAMFSLGGCILVHDCVGAESSGGGGQAGPGGAGGQGGDGAAGGVGASGGASNGGGGPCGECAPGDTTCVCSGELCAVESIPVFDVKDVGGVGVTSEVVAWSSSTPESGAMLSFRSPNGSWKDDGAFDTQQVVDVLGAFGRIEGGRLFYQPETADSAAFLCNPTTCGAGFMPFLGRLSDVVRHSTAGGPDVLAWMSAGPNPTVCVRSGPPSMLEPILVEETPSEGCHVIESGDGGSLYVRPSGAVLLDTRGEGGLVAQVDPAMGVMALDAPPKVRAMAATELCGQSFTRAYVAAGDEDGDVFPISYLDLADGEPTWVASEVVASSPLVIAADAYFFYVGGNGVSVYRHPMGTVTNGTAPAFVLEQDAKVVSIDASHPDFVFFTSSRDNTQYVSRWRKRKGPLGPQGEP